MIMVGTRSFLIFAPILLDCPVRPRFHVNTTARTTGDSAIWFSMTCQAEKGSNKSVHIARQPAKYAERQPLWRNIHGPGPESPF